MVSDIQRSGRCGYVQPCFYGGVVSKEKKCGYPVMFRYTWPGNDETFCCMVHATQIQKVAAAIDMHLQMIGLSDEERIKLTIDKVTCSTIVEG